MKANRMYATDAQEKERCGQCGATIGRWRYLIDKYKKHDRRQKGYCSPTCREIAAHKITETDFGPLLPQ